MSWQEFREAARKRLEQAELDVQGYPEGAIVRAMEAVELELKAFMKFKGLFRNFKDGDRHHRLIDLEARICSCIDPRNRFELCGAVRDVEHVQAEDKNGSTIDACWAAQIPNERYPNGLIRTEALAREKVEQSKRVFRILDQYFSP